MVDVIGKMEYATGVIDFKILENPTITNKLYLTLLK